MAFENAAEQQATVRGLRAALRAGRLPHAMLFLGSEGTGRLDVARELARALLCRAAEAPDDYCGDCQDCRLCQAGRHPDCEELGLPPGRQLFPIKAVQNVQATASLRPVRGPRRVFIIRDADRMSIDAANCFLKTLEEPPGGCVFVLLAASLRDIPQTIVSRCRIVRFANLPADVLERRLQESGMEARDASWLARRAWGSPGLAERLRSAGLAEFNRQMVERLLHVTTKQNFALSDWFLENAPGAGPAGRDDLQELLECALAYYRDAALAAASGRAECDLFNAFAEEQVRGAAAGASPDAFLDRADVVLEAIERVGANANRRLALDDLFTRLGRLEEPPT